MVFASASGGMATLMWINERTRSHHAAADASWLDLLVPAVTVADYRRQLVHVYGFEAPLEAALASTPLGSTAELRQRARSGLLAQDLLALQYTPTQLAALPRCMIAPFRGVTEALAWMYVMERPTSLHSPIRRHLTSRMPELAGASSYLAQSARLVTSRWDELGVMLDTVARSSQIHEQILAATQDAFRCAVDWFHQAEPASAAEQAALH